jgi:hypothetical protein
MRSLTRAEQETIVVFNEEEPQASVYTYNRSLKKNLRELSEKFPQNVTLERKDGWGGETFLIPKKWVKVRAPRVVTEEERKKKAAALKANLAKNRPATIGETGNELPGEYTSTTRSKTVLYPR